MNSRYIIVLLVTIIVFFTFFNPKTKEHFATEEVPLKSINLRGRNIVFPYFERNNLTASQRALADTTLVKTSPQGICRLDYTNGATTESHNIVHENSLFYTLKHSCLALRMNKYELDKAGYLALYFENNANNLANLLLLNPLYVEFVIDSARTTAGYRMEPTLQFYNKQLAKTVKLVFIPVINNNVGACDKSFNYRDYSPAQTMITQTDLNKVLNNNGGILNLKAFYLDKMATSFQNIGRALTPRYNPKGTIKLFEKDFQKYYQNTYATQIYEFMNNFSMLYINSISPVFTFDLTLTISPEQRQKQIGKKYIIAKTFMDQKTEKYTYPFCADYEDLTNSRNIANILGLAIEGKDANNFNLIAFTSYARNCMGDKQVIKLPYVSSSYNINITVTPNEKLITVMWKDGMDKHVYFIKASNAKASAAYDICTQSKEQMQITNDLGALFNRKEEIADVLFNYDPIYIKEFKSFTLGYVNLLEHYINFE